MRTVFSTQLGTERSRSQKKCEVDKSFIECNERKKYYLIKKTHDPAELIDLLCVTKSLVNKLDLSFNVFTHNLNITIDSYQALHFNVYADNYPCS